MHQWRNPITSLSLPANRKSAKNLRNRKSRFRATQQKKNKIQKNISGPVNKYGPKSGPMFVWTVDLNCQFCHIFCQVCQLLFGDYYFSVVLSFKVTKGINYARYNCIYCINYWINYKVLFKYYFLTTQKCVDRSNLSFSIIYSYLKLKISTL